MRYIGNKENIITKIDAILRQKGVVGTTLFDLFSGTASVAKYYKALGYQVYTSDMLYFSYCLQKAYIENNETPQFKGVLPLINNGVVSQLFSDPLEDVLTYLTNLQPIKGFIYKHYTPDGSAELPQPRMYFSNLNGQKIDAIRQKIEQWQQEGLLEGREYYILLAALIESVSFYANISGVYAAFHKKWDPRAIKELVLRNIKILDNGKINRAYNADSLELLDKIDVDILYLDPPYNNRQYLPNYHLLETIAKYDSPAIKGVTGVRDYSQQKSGFCSAKTALQHLEKIASRAKYKYLVLSYNSEGIMAQEDIIATLSKYGSLEVEQFEYLRFKSNNNGLSKNTKHVYEQLYILKNGKC